MLDAGDERHSARARQAHDGVNAEHRARGFFDEHVVSLRRIRQLAETDGSALLRPDGTEVQPRFNQEGVEAEKAEARAQLLPRWEGDGWVLAQPVERLWAGERDLAALTGTVPAKNESCRTGLAQIARLGPTL